MNADLAGRAVLPPRPRSRVGLGACWVAALFWSVTPSITTAAEYKLTAGDVLDFAVAGSPDLRQSVPIDMDGTVSLPLVGEVMAAGRSLPELRAAVRQQIAQKEVPQRTPGSPRGATDVIWPDQVSLAVSEYHPIYVNGDVAKPGEQKFKPGMTVRQALSLAGGYDVLRFRMDNPFIESSQLRGDYEAAWIDYAREQARLSRLHAELGSDAPTPAADAKLNPPLPADLLGRIRDTEASLLKVRNADYEKQKSHYTLLLAQQDTNITSLAQAHDTEASGTQYDQDEFNRVNGLYKQGTLPMVRVVEARRLMLLSATQALQSQVELDHAKTEREVTRRQGETIDDNRRKDLFSAAQDSQTKLADIRARIQSIGDKLLYVGALKTQLGQGAGEQPRLTLFRTGQPAAAVAQDAALQPGDVVDVALRADQSGMAASAPAMR